jgi:capsular polysaccharide biosynthesis protein
MTEAPADLRDSFVLVRRRWVVIALMAVLGLCGGAAYGFLHKPQPAAVESMLLPIASTPGAPVTDSRTAIYIATSDAVLLPAGGSVRPSLPAGNIRRLVHAVAVGDNIIQVQAQASQQAQATQLASAVVDGYIAYAKKNGLGTVLPIGNPSAVAAPSLVRSTAIPGAIGLLAALAISVTVLLLLARRDHRLRQRDQIAATIGVPVVASIGAQPYKSAAQWVRLLEGFEPTPLNSWGLSRLLRALVPVDLDGQLTIQIVSFADDKAALATGPQLALFAAQSGIRTLLAPGDYEAVEPLTMACATLRQRNLGNGFLHLETDPEWGQDGVGSANLIVSVVAVERSRPSLSSFVGSTILSVSAGFPVVDDLARVALAASRGGLGIDGVVVVNPDPGDGTAGLLPDRASRGCKAQMPTETHRLDFRSLK